MAFTFFTTLGLYLFLRAQNLPKLLPLSITAFVFAIYSYFPARIFIPLFCIGLSLIYFRFFLIHKKVTIITFLVLIILLFPFIQNLFSPIGFARWHQVNIFSNPPENNAVFQHIISNYFGHFSVDFLFLKGDIDMPGQFVTRHSIRGLGELYLFQLPLVAFGLFSLLKRRNKSFLILLLWLLLYPVGSMFTTDNSPQGTRSIIGVIPFQILSAIGIIYLLHIASKIKKPFYAASISVSLIIVIVSLFSYVSLYFTSYVNYSSDFWGWQYGARDIVHYFAFHETKYDNLIMAPEFNAPEIFFKFYAPNTCKKCVVGLPDTYYHPELKQLFVVTPTYLEVHPAYKFSTRKIIYYPNGLIAFRIGEIVK